jgi:hypothetical protein
MCFLLVVASTLVVAIGIFFEFPDTKHTFQEWWGNRPSNTKRFIPKPDRNRDPLWSMIGFILVAVGVAAEGVFEGCMGIADTRLRQFDESAIATAESKAGDAATSAAIAKNAADDALQDLAILESRVSGRQIFDTTPIKALRLRGKVVYVASGDIEEAKSFCKSISAALYSTAGMDSKPSCRSTYAGSETIVRGPSFSESQALPKR